MPRMAFALVVVAVVLTGCGSEPSRSSNALPSGQPSVSGSPSPTDSSSTPPIPGKVTGRIQMHDAVWGDLVVTTSVTYNSGFESNCGQPHLRVVDASGQTRLRRDWTWGCGELAPNRPSTDKTGNVFLSYNPGRYNGVSVLRAAGGRLEDFGTLPASGDNYQGKGPFGYYVQTQDKSPHDGVLEIMQFSNNCTPSCAGGTITSELFVWNGQRYVKQGRK